LWSSRPLPGVAPGRGIGIGFKTSPQGVDWRTLEQTWALAADLDVFQSGWLNDHLMDPRLEFGGYSLESMTTLAALARSLPGKWIGHSVVSNTFRHPALMVKAIGTLDQITDGHTILGLGAGWHVGEHKAFGVELPPIGERIDRLASAVRVFKALFSPAASGPPGVELDDPYYPLSRAVNGPPPKRPGGPPIFLGGQGPRGLRLAAREADGWVTRNGRDSPVEAFPEKADVLRRTIEQVRRDPSYFSILATVNAGVTAEDRRKALADALLFVRSGATHIVIAITAAAGPAALRLAAREVAEPLFDAAS